MQFSLKQATIYMLIFFVAIFIVFSGISAEANGYLPGSKQNVIVLHSYHKGFAWTDKLNNSILEKLNGMSLTNNVFVEHLDWKRYPTGFNLQLLYEEFEYKYSGMQIDLIIATDDAAVEFALQNRDVLFSSAPIVFAGLNIPSFTRLVQNNSNITGIIESIDYEAMVDSLLEVFPNTQDVYLAYDLTESGLATGFSARNAINQFAPTLDTFPLNGLTHDDIIERASHLQEGSVVLLLAYTTDIDGNVIAPEVFAKMLSENSNVPIIATYDKFLGHGIFGGSMMDMQLHGQHISYMASRILNGEGVDDIEVIHEPQVRTAYDYNVLMRLGVPIDALPDGSEVINRPFSFYETYRTYVLLTSGAIVVLTILLVIISIFAQRLNVFKDRLQQSYQELMQLHEELVASEEELRSQFEELEVLTRKLQESDERYRLILDASNDAIVEWDFKDNSFTFSDRWFDLTGYTPEEITNLRPWKNIIHDDELQKFHRLFTMNFDSMVQRDKFAYRILQKSGVYKWMYLRRSVVFDSNNHPVRLISAHSDIDHIVKAQNELEHIANHEFVTGLRNKRAMIKRLEELISSEDTKPFGLIFMDIDNFKTINNSIGHSFGDLLLKDISGRIIKAVGDESAVFSIGGANFAVLRYFDHIQDANTMIDTIRQGFSKAIEVHGVLVNIGFSIGVTMFPYNGTSSEELLRNTDIAMHEAKRIGKGNVVYFGQLMKIQLMERMVLEENLRNALSNSEFSLHFQPQLNLETGKVRMFEALLRWNNPRLGNVSPMQFIKLAEETHLIVPIGEWVIDEACAMLSKIHAQGFVDIGMSINVSLVQIIRENFTDFVKKTIKKYNLPAELVEFEITETMFMESLELINERLHDMTLNGMLIALDDFGKGYSSLNYLKQMPIVKIKIDKSFLDGINASENQVTILDYIVLIGKRMGKRVLAEGVETFEQLEYMLNSGCDDIQGYLLSKPMPEVRVVEFIREVNVMGRDNLLTFLKQKVSVF